MRQVSELRLLGLVLLLLKVVVLCPLHGLSWVLDTAVTLSGLAWNAESLLLPLQIALLLVHHLLLKLVVLHALHVVGGVHWRDHLGSIEVIHPALLLSSSSLALRALAIGAALLLRLQKVVACTVASVVL